MDTKQKAAYVKKKLNERGKALKIASRVINGERQDMYGNPEDSFGLIAEYWSTYLNSTEVVNSLKIDLSPRNVAEMMILFKVARMSGQKTSLDNYADCCGYAAIAGDMI
jgi:hypothetical protein